MKRTLRRESKALEIVGREALGARRFGPPGMSSADARGRARCCWERRQRCLRCFVTVTRPRPSIPEGRPASASRMTGGQGKGRALGLAPLLRAALPAVIRGAEEQKTRASFGGQGAVRSGGFVASGGRESGARQHGASSSVR